MYVKERFILSDYVKDFLEDLEPPFGYDGFGEFLFFRTYSRNINGKQETWSNCVIRVIEGVMSIRKNHYLNNHISWNEKDWQKYAEELVVSMFKMHWLPPGRGLWCMGTDFIYERGAMALYNCAYSDVNSYIVDDLCWIMDCLMLGVGIGFSPLRQEIEFKNPKGSYEFIIGDSREGWIDSVKAIYDAYWYGSSKPRFNYSEVRDKGLPIKGFGGVASGPEPLKCFHIQIEEAIDRYMTDRYYDSVMLKTDLINQVGACVVAGNVRRSAELGSLSIKDPVFKDLKNYKKFPYRAPWGWMSNNSVKLEQDEDFELLYNIAQRVIENGEPGYMNLQNMPLGRIGKKDKLRKDRAVGFNPCGEIPLEHREVCNIDETFPTMCSISEWYKACEYACFYTSTVSLLPTHQPSTNRVVAKNRRIGVSLVDFTGWLQEDGLSMVTKYLRKGYKIIRKANKQFNNEAGVPEAIRVTTVKPGGTVPKLAGRTSGASYPNFHEMIRRVKVARNSSVHKLLVEAGLPYEADFLSHGTDVFEWPLKCGPAPPAEEISVWQQAMNLVLLQREWADNAVSNTLNFRPKWKLIKRFSILEGCSNPFDSTKKWLLKNINDDFVYESFMQDFSKYYEELQHGKYKIKVKLNQNLKAEEINIYEFDAKHEEDSIEPLLSAIAPLTKSVSLLPHTNKGCYQQMPEEGITKEEYELRLNRIKKIDWSRLSNSDGIDTKFCDGDKCEI